MRVAIVLACVALIHVCYATEDEKLFGKLGDAAKKGMGAVNAAKDGNAKGALNGGIAAAKALMGGDKDKDKKNIPTPPPPPGMQGKPQAPGGPQAQPNPTGPSPGGPPIPQQDSADRPTAPLAQGPATAQLNNPGANLPSPASSQIKEILPKICPKSLPKGPPSFLEVESELLGLRRKNTRRKESGPPSTAVAPSGGSSDGAVATTPNGPPVSVPPSSAPEDTSDNCKACKIVIEYIEKDTDAHDEPLGKWVEAWYKGEDQSVKDIAYSAFQALHGDEHRALARVKSAVASPPSNMSAWYTTYICAELDCCEDNDPKAKDIEPSLKEAVDKALKGRGEHTDGFAVYEVGDAINKPRVDLPDGGEGGGSDQQLDVEESH